MLSKILRILLALTAIAPLSISMAYIFGAKIGNSQRAIIATFVCLLLGGIALWVIDFARKQLERLPVTIKKAKSADKEVIGFFIAYVLPLVFKGTGVPDVGAWVLAAGLLLFVLWSTHAMQVNPVLGMFGFHFYEVETEDGITYLLITRRQISTVRSIRQVVQLSEYGVLEASDRRDE
ncbi:MAG: hypothetical protein AB1540_17650 [Bdellovibrionota bacterium]